MNIQLVDRAVWLAKAKEAIEVSTAKIVETMKKYEEYLNDYSSWSWFKRTFTFHDHDGIVINFQAKIFHDKKNRDVALKLVNLLSTPGTGEIQMSEKDVRIIELQQRQPSDVFTAAEDMIVVPW